MYLYVRDTRARMRRARAWGMKGQSKTWHHTPAACSDVSYICFARITPELQSAVLYLLTSLRATTLGADV